MLHEYLYITIKQGLKFPWNPAVPISKAHWNVPQLFYPQLSPSLNSFSIIPSEKHRMLRTPVNSAQRSVELRCFCNYFLSSFNQNLHLVRLVHHVRLNSTDVSPIHQAISIILHNSAIPLGDKHFSLPFISRSPKARHKRTIWMSHTRAGHDNPRVLSKRPFPWLYRENVTNFARFAKRIARNDKRRFVVAERSVRSAEFLQLICMKMGRTRVTSFKRWYRESRVCILGGNSIGAKKYIIITLSTVQNYFSNTQFPI